MTVMNRDDQLTQVLGAGIESFDIPEDQFKVAEFAYKAACDFLSTYWSGSGTGGALYPQGSMRLGTVTALIHRHDEYDLDMVCRHDLELSQIDPEDLKADVGDALENFVKEHPELRLTLDDEGRRCWTFVHDLLPFHMDVLPAIPNAAAEPNGIWATDTEGSRWHPSAPTDYADWFLGVLHDEWLAGAIRIAESRQMDVEQLPRNAFKTTLQRTVQALKRHRDIYFSDDPSNRPSSIIITTLAARSYEPGGDLFNVLHHVVHQMPDHVESRFGRYVIANPVEPDENFADRWIGHPVRARRFFEWLEAAQRDFTAIGDAHDTGDMLDQTALALGIRAARAAEQAVATGTTARRSAMIATRVPAGSDRFA
ncbi:hypothetical protein GA0070624_3268 [Micromonospora rhizosphaerae]|uniref:Nucleotidyltransferase n=1 Tax=Micromonospora rhizosphaerae TaxID=568872 RepID=A0A1C6S9U6_9ACTN|nr:hypothetical protein GA0070624_3268 [Micromonospora rhizosphaerae]